MFGLLAAHRQKGSLTNEMRSTTPIFLVLISEKGMDQDPGRDFSVPISASDQQRFSQQPWALITKGSQVCAAMKGERQRVIAAKRGHQYITDNLQFSSLSLIEQIQSGQVLPVP